MATQILGKIDIITTAAQLWQKKQGFVQNRAFPKNKNFFLSKEGSHTKFLEFNLLRAESTQLPIGRCKPGTGGF